MSGQESEGEFRIPSCHIEGKTPEQERKASEIMGPAPCSAWHEPPEAPSISPAHRGRFGGIVMDDDSLNHVVNLVDDDGPVPPLRAGLSVSHELVATAKLMFEHTLQLVRLCHVLLGATEIHVGNSVFPKLNNLLETVSYINSLAREQESLMDVINEGIGGNEQ